MESKSGKLPQRCATGPRWSLPVTASVGGKAFWYRVRLAALACVLGFWVVYKYHWGLAEVIMTLRHEEALPNWLAQAAKWDPILGRKIEMPIFMTAQGRVKVPEPQGLTGVVFIGNCAACSARKEMQTMQGLDQRFPSVRFYAIAPGNDSAPLQQLWRTYGLRTPLLLDRDGRAAQRLNAYFEFRLYVMDSKSRLLYRSLRGQRLRQVANDLKRLVTEHTDGT
jgi:hypothetical protein